MFSIRSYVGLLPKAARRRVESDVMGGRMPWFALALLCCVFIAACSEQQAEEFVFKTVLEHDLVKLCDEDKACAAAVKSQLKGCMEKGKWRQYLENQDDEEEAKRFTHEFYACIVDADGDPYFQSNL